jgi:glycosyltransferase involved in cell wall biosynthesis
MPEHLLIYEPRTEGHHLGWLRFLVEDLLSANYRLSLAVDLRPEAKPKLQDHLAELVSEVQLISAYDTAGRRHEGGRAESVALCLEQSGAERVFLAAIDEVASSCWRRAALGMYPPDTLRGRFGGIYHRPRFLVAPWWSPNRWVKTIGFRRVLQGGWLRQLLFVDEFLAASLRQQFSAAPIFFLPDACPDNFGGDSRTARKKLGLPLDRRILLCFGTGARRKGLHVAVAAMGGLPPEEPPFLLCAGQLNAQGHTARSLEKLVKQNRAAVFDRYVSAEEEPLCFAAADIVLLPYLNHFGTSGVLSRAMAAGKMIIASDEQLLGQLTRTHGLGLLFPSGDVMQLRECIRKTAGMSTAELASWATAARQYAAKYSRAAFREGLLIALGNAAK